MTHAQIAGVGAPARPLPPPRRPGSPWAPMTAGPFKLPREAGDRLAVALAGLRNRDAAFALATFLARHWSSPGRLATPFPADRRALADHSALGLSEARVRGAIAALVAVGFLEPQEAPAGRRYQRTAEGLHRRPVTYRFGGDYGQAFARANAATQRARGAPAPARRPVPRPEAPRPSPADVATPRPMPALQVAHNQNPPDRGLFMGDQNQLVPDSPLEAALARLGVLVGRNK
jgi:Replication protein C N-terminal domain